MVTNATFQLRGEFAGFIRDARGKRRMLLRTESQDWHLKLPRELREALPSALISGRTITVTGRHEPHRSSGEIRHIIAKLELDGTTPEACAVCPISICTKKNCWKNGGRNLWEALQRQIDAAGLSSEVKLQATGCLDACKAAPNLSCGTTHLRGCKPAAAEEILTQILAKR